MRVEASLNWDLSGRKTFASKAGSALFRFLAIFLVVWAIRSNRGARSMPAAALNRPLAVSADPGDDRLADGSSRSRNGGPSRADLHVFAPDIASRPVQGAGAT